jgi:diguanylate cyclase (GGDEF)-like protein
MGEKCAEGCMLEITSSDMIGEIEQSFNDMTEAIARRLTLEEISQALHAKLSDTVELEDVARIVLNAITETKGSKVGALYGDNGEFYELLFDFGLDRGDHLLKNLDLDDGPVALAIESGNILTLSPQRDDLEWIVQTTPLVKFRPKNMLAIPLMSKGKAVGLVLSAGDKDALSSEQLQILESIRKQGAPYLQSAILHRKIRDLAALDDLTMILNRRFGLRRLREEFSRSVRHGVPLSVLMVDVDHFKKFNDSYGHDAGDGILKMVARIIESDIRSGDVVCRYGGEEFMLVAPGTGLNDAARLGERVRRTIEATQVPWGEQQFQVTVSIGVATWPMAGVSVCEELISAADQALYNAKESGRNQVSKNWGGLVPAVEELVDVGQEH